MRDRCPKRRVRAGGCSWDPLREQGWSLCLRRSELLVLLRGQCPTVVSPLCPGKGHPGPTDRKGVTILGGFGREVPHLVSSSPAAEQKFRAVTWPWGSGPCRCLLGFGLSEDGGCSEGACAPWPGIASLLLGSRGKKTCYKKHVIKRRKYGAVPVANGREWARSAVLLLPWVSE